MPIDPYDFRTGGALQGAVAASIVRHRDAGSELVPGIQVGIYRVLRELGRGGMAIVYLAERADGEYEQQVALKWMQGAQHDGAAEALFRRERQALADLRHPHIARLLDGGRTLEDRLWFAMEYIEGEPLDRHCVQRALPSARRLVLFLQVCNAVAFAHARGVIHRDIKPSNVLVDADGSAKLLDFGIAQLIGEEDADTGRAFTPGFASPEQQRGETVTVASDVYQLGRLLAAVLSATDAERRTVAEREATRTMAPRADASTEGLRAAAGPEPDAALPAGLEADLAAILAKATALDPFARYANVEALANDVRAFTQRRPISARPRRAAYVATRYAQRHPIAVPLGALALAALVGLSAYFTLRLRDQRDLAQRERDAATEQASISNAALAFVREDLLAAADPQNGGGRDVTVRETLDRAADKVGERFADAPLEEATVRLTLADVYQGLGDLQQAEVQARAGVDAAARSDSPTAHALGAYIRLSWALALAFQQRLDEALAALPTPPEGDSGDKGLEETYVRADLLRSNYVLVQRHIEQADGIAARAVERALRLQGEQGELYFEALFFRATPLRLLGRYDEALAILRKVEAYDVERLGPDHVKNADTRHLIGMTLRAMGQLDVAERTQRDVLSLRRQVLGADHPKSLAAQRELATTLQDLGRYEESALLFEAMLETSLRVNGPDHRSTFDIRNNLGLCYALGGRLEDSETQFTELLAIASRTAVSDKPAMIVPLGNLALLRGKQARFSDAEARYREATALADASLDPDDWQHVALESGWAVVLDMQGRCAEAEGKWQAAEARLRRSRDDGHPQIRMFEEKRIKSQAERAAAGHVGAACAVPAIAAPAIEAN